MQGVAEAQAVVGRGCRLAARAIWRRSRGVRPPPLLQAGEPLGRFLDYCTYGHMIDNVVLIVTGTLHERDVQVRRQGSVAAAALSGCWCSRLLVQLR